MIGRMISVFGITDKGIVRTQNQDAYCYGPVEEQKVWGVVCDGMGGAKAGDIASKIAVEVFEDHMRRWSGSGQTGEHPGLLRSAIEEGNRAIFLSATNNKEYTGMGTTLVGAVLDGENACVANVGDSRAYHISQDGIGRITRDHSVVEALVAHGDLTPEQARVHPQKNLITRAMGTGKAVEPDIFEVSLHPGDWLLLCSDGLINELVDEEILRLVREAENPEAACQSLLDLALRREASDNVTILLFYLETKA